MDADSLTTNFTVTEAKEVGIAIASTSNGCMDVNERLCSMLGYAPDELIGKHWTLTIQASDVAGVVAKYERVVSGEICGYSLVVRCTRKDHAVITANFTIYGLRRPAGVCDSVVILLTQHQGGGHAASAVEASSKTPARRIGNLEVDLIGHSVKGPRGEVVLTQIEWQLLLVLLHSEPRVVPRFVLVEAIWGRPYREDVSLLHDAISRLRRHLAEVGPEGNYIQTVHRIGYRLLEASGAS